MNEKKLKYKLSDNERIKKNSNFLRGTISKDLKDGLTGGFNGDNIQLIRFHGMYQQDDRDIRYERISSKLEPLINMMLRCRLPGGIINTKQWIAISDFAKKETIYGSIRLTTRQTIQLHGIIKSKLKNIHKIINKFGIDSIATAGDANRNVLCTSNPIESEIHYQCWLWSKKISNHLLPKTEAYSEIWLDNYKNKKNNKETILGDTYLPRKFKISIAIPPLNDVDIHANDLNLIAISKKNKLLGFNILVGGGLSMTYGDKKTYPRKSSEFGFVKLKNILKIVETIVKIQRDLGDRKNRKYAKTKYTIDRIGIQNFKKEVENRSKIIFDPIKPYIFTHRGDNFGWILGIDNKWHLTLFIENGRIIDKDNYKLQTALYEIAKIHTGDFRLTPNQNLIIANIKNENKKQIEKLIEKYELINKNISLQKKSSMACVSFPTCPLAMAEAERNLSKFVYKIEKIMSKYNLQEEEIIFRITGCPNGCARAMLAEIGLTGRSIGRYNLYLGGDKIGTRIPRIYKENIDENEIFEILDKTIKIWSIKRKNKESYGDFVIRFGIVKPVLNSTYDFYKN